MLASELISELSKLRDTYGDKHVVIQYPEGRIDFKTSGYMLAGCLQGSIQLHVYGSELERGFAREKIEQAKATAD